MTRAAVAQDQDKTRTLQRSRRLPDPDGHPGRPGLAASSVPCLAAGVPVVVIAAPGPKGDQSVAAGRLPAAACHEINVSATGARN
jgi:hypothetical protein